MNTLDPPTDRVDFFHLAQRGFERAERACGVTDVYLGLAGRVIRLRLAGLALQSRVLPALARQQVAATAAPALTIQMWDDVSTGTRLPVLLEIFLREVKAAHGDWLDARHAVRGFNDERVHTVFRLGPQAADILSVFDAAQASAVYWTHDATLLPYWECGSPLQTLLNWWAESEGLQYVHAAAVGNEGGAVLLAGQGGSGKSTAALACLDSDLAYLADDYCLVGLVPEPRVYSIYNTAKVVGHDDLARFPRLAATVVNPHRAATDKALLDLHPRGACRWLDAAPIRAVLAPIVTGQDCPQLLPMSRHEALQALAPSTLGQLAGAHQASFSRMVRLVSAVPCYRLRMGGDVTAIPPLLAGLLATLSPV
ncbi:MAG TPA: serine kinase [Candidatus Xenobia bacterium]|jgi:hypothetical protein